jgi:hypothetical protein
VVRGCPLSPQTPKRALSIPGTLDPATADLGLESSCSSPRSGFGCWSGVDMATSTITRLKGQLVKYLDSAY